MDQSHIHDGRDEGDAVGPLPPVGVIGVGAMGEPMARRLLHAGGEVWLRSRRRVSAEDLLGQGAHWAESSADLARRARIILVALPRLEDLEQMLDGQDGLLAGAEWGSRALVLTSTCDPNRVRALERRLAERAPGLDLVDAPVSGGVEGAKRGTLSIMVGHDGPLSGDVRRVLDLLGTAVELGSVGAGQVAKACNQLIVASAALAIAEASVIAERAGIPLSTLLPLLRGGYADSAVLSAKLSKFVTKDYTPDGKAAYMLKDLRFARTEAERSGIRAPLLEAGLRQFEELVAAGMGDDDLAVTQRYVESSSRATAQ